MRLQDFIRQLLTEDDEPKPKPSGTSAEDAGTKPDNDVQQKDVDKANGDAAKDAAAPPPPPQAPAGGAGGGMGNQAPPPIQNNFRQQIDIGKIVDPYQLKQKIEHPITQEFVIGEQLRVISNDDLHDFFNVEHQQQPLAPEHWLSNLTPPVVQLLTKIQGMWLKQRKSTPVMNTVLNTIAKIPNATTHVPSAVERGMQIPIKDLKEFLRPFVIGETLDTPASGFSTVPHKARTNANTDDADVVGVLIRLFPNPAGELHVMQLHKSEVIRPEGPLARVSAVTKFIVLEKRQFVRAYYVIDLEDQGYEEDVLQTEGLHKDERDIETAYPVFCQFMNTPFWATNNAA